MQLFFKSKSKNDQIHLENNQVLAYGYKSLACPYKVQFVFTIILNIKADDEKTIKYIQDWIYQSSEHTDFYREISFGVNFGQKAIKEITFLYAQISSCDEQLDYKNRKLLLSLYIKQKEDKINDVIIYPIIKPKILESKFKDDLKPKILESKFKDDLKPEILGAQAAYDTDASDDTDIESKNTKLFRKKIKKQKDMTEEHKEDLVVKFANAPEIVQNIFLNYVPDNSVKFVELEKGIAGQQDNRKKYIEIDYTHNLSTDYSLVSTYLHEHGHLLDFKSGSVISEDETFIKLLKRDFKKYISKYMEKNNVTKNVAYEEISKKMMENKYEHEIISDLYGAMSDNACRAKLIHPVEYWKKSKKALPREATAHFFEAQFDPNILKVVKEFFPRSMKRFYELLPIIEEQSEKEKRCVIS